METQIEYDPHYQTQNAITIAGTVWKPDGCDHNYFEVTMPASLLKTVKRLQSFVIREDVYCIAKFNDDCVALDKLHREHDLLCLHDWWYQEDLNCIDPDDPDDRLTIQGCEGMCLRVTASFIQWNWSASNGSAGESCESAEIPINDIEKAFKL